MGLLVCEKEIEDGQIETKGGTQGYRENGRKKERITVRNKSGVCHPDVLLLGSGGNGTILEIPSCCFCHTGTTLPQNGITLKSTGPLLTGTLSHPWPFCLFHSHHVYLVPKNIYISST